MFNSLLLRGMSDIRIQGVTDIPLCRISFLHLSTYPKAFSRLLILVALASVTNDFKWPRRHLQIFYIWAHPWKIYPTNGSTS